jgi:hypothetical protein
MNRLSLSTFLTITALSVAGLVSHSSAHKGHLQPNLRRRRHSRGRASRSWPPVDRRGSCRAAQKIGVGLGVDCVRPIVQGTAQRRKASKALPGRSANRSCLQSPQSKLWESQRKPAGSNPARYATRARRLLENHRCAREGQIMTQSLFLYRHAEAVMQIIGTRTTTMCDSVT